MDTLCTWDTIPTDVHDIIYKWELEFHRFDATERYHAHKELYSSTMNYICEDIRLNMPYYTFYIVLPHTRATISLFVSDMDPIKTGQEVIRVPSDILTYIRRALSLPHYQRVQ